jgi:uncharacterized membrane protein
MARKAPWEEGEPYRNDRRLRMLHGSPQMLAVSKVPVVRKLNVSGAKGGIPMGKILENLNVTIAIGVGLAIALMSIFHVDALTLPPIFRWLHVFFGITWIGLLYYFNFVQIPTMPSIPAELKPAVSKYIAPNALFYFRWGAAFTVLTGAILAWLNGYLVEALTFTEGFRLIGTGMWLALIMAFNVWFIIWPNQKRALGLVEADDSSNAKSGRTAMLASRTNTLLSIPMLYAMTTFQSLPA